MPIFGGRAGVLAESISGRIAERVDHESIPLDVSAAGRLEESIDESLDRGVVTVWQVIGHGFRHSTWGTD